MNRPFTFSAGFIILSLVVAGCSSAPKNSSAVKAAPAKSISTPPVAKSAPATEQKSAAAKDEEPVGHALVTCVYGSTKREIAITKKDGGCAVTYSKDGNTSEIASGSATSSKCADVQNTVRGNLEKAGYSCN